MLTIDLQLKEVYTSKGVAVQVGATAQIKINDDDKSVAQAARHFLGKGTDAMKDIAQPILERHLCALLATMFVEEIQQSRGLLGSKIQQLAAADMAALGLGIVDVSIRDARDPPGKVQERWGSNAQRILSLFCAAIHL